MKVYISGAISGLTEQEFTENFDKAAEWCVKNDHEVVNPLQVPACATEDCWERFAHVQGAPKPGGGGPVKSDGTTFLHHWRCYMEHDIIAIFKCDAILMLPNWDDSKGAKIEKTVAQGLGLKYSFLVDDYSRMSGGWITP